MSIPKHVAIIMDGNGRWARERKLPRVAGHKKGLERVEEIVFAASKRGVRYVSMFAFSTENWTRPKPEIDFLFSLIDIFIDKYHVLVMKENIRFRMIGRRDRINAKLMQRIVALESVSSHNTGLTLIMALDYGGRWDIIQAAAKVACAGVPMDAITDEVFGRELQLGDAPDPDLLIRTSGEQRVSNFLLWNLAYAEFYFPKICWPDFDEQAFESALAEYEHRQRTYGAVVDNV